MFEQELTNLRILEWLHDLPDDPKETILTIQGVDQNSIKYISPENTDSNWVAPDGPLRVPESNRDLRDFGRSTGTSIDMFVRGVGIGLTNTENRKPYDQKSNIGKRNWRAGNRGQKC